MGEPLPNLVSNPGLIAVIDFFDYRKKTTIRGISYRSMLNIERNRKHRVRDIQEWLKSTANAARLMEINESANRWKN